MASSSAAASLSANGNSDADLKSSAGSSNFVAPSSSLPEEQKNAAPSSFPAASASNTGSSALCVPAGADDDFDECAGLREPTVMVSSLDPNLIKVVKPPDFKAAWNFYRRIGSPKHVVAPMVDQSELAFRLLTRKYGADLCYTPMLHAAMYITHDIYREKHFSTAPGDRPLIAQFCANDPLMLLQAARMIEGQVDAVDINFGCPQGIAKRGNYGSFLLDYPDTMIKLISVLHAHLNIPVTCKIRVLPDDEDTIRLVKAIEQAGCSILTVHGRTRQMKKHLTGPCNFDIIKRIKQELHIPVFANGGIETLEDVKKCLEYTGVDGVMTSEGILSSPDLFSGGSVDPLDMAEEYYALALKHNTRMCFVKGHLFKILHQQLCVHTELREWLGRARDESVAQLFPKIRAAREALGPNAAAAYAKHPSWYRRYQGFKLSIGTKTQPVYTTCAQLNDMSSHHLPNAGDATTHAKGKAAKPAISIAACVDAEDFTSSFTGLFAQS